MSRHGNSISPRPLHSRVKHRTYECSPSENLTPIPLILVLKNNPFLVKRELFHSKKDPYFSTTLTYIYIDYELYLFIDFNGKVCMKQERRLHVYYMNNIMAHDSASLHQHN